MLKPNLRHEIVRSLRPPIHLRLRRREGFPRCSQAEHLLTRFRARTPTEEHDLRQGTESILSPSLVQQFPEGSPAAIVPTLALRFVSIAQPVLQPLPPHATRCAAR